MTLCSIPLILVLTTLASSESIEYIGNWTQAMVSSCSAGQLVATTSTKGDSMLVELSSSSYPMSCHLTDNSILSILFYFYLVRIVKSLKIYGAFLPNSGAKFNISFAGQNYSADSSHSTSLNSEFIPSNPSCSTLFISPFHPSGSTNTLIVQHEGPGLGVEGDGVLTVDAIVVEFETGDTSTVNSPSSKVGYSP